jgi:ribosomal protein S18 acetylase RimI-like enzyme
MADVTIRPATPADEAALGRYGGALMRLHHAWDPRRFLSTPDPERGYGRFLVSQIGGPESVVLVAEHDAAVIGYVWATLEPTSWKDLRAACGFVHDVFVDDGARRLGAGEALVRAAIAWLEAHGVPRVVLMSAARNETAQRLFDRLGFRRTMVEMTREAGG